MSYLSLIALLFKFYRLVIIAREDFKADSPHLDVIVVLENLV